jgi:RNA polymerase sigma-70 factor (ECF subfamily)
MTVVAPTVAESEALDSQALLEQAQRGDPEAFCELCRLHETRLLRQAASLCGNSILAEDLAQDTLIEAWKSLSRYNGRCRFFTWLCAILLNRYRNFLRQKPPLLFSAHADSQRADAADPLEKFPGVEAWPDQAAVACEQAASVRKCIQALRPKHQQVVYLRFFVDDSLEGIAAALGCSVGTVKSRLFHALDKLRCMKEIAARCPPSHASTPSNNEKL